jgi:hypothetical protein
VVVVVGVPSRGTPGSNIAAKKTGSWRIIK